MAHRLLIGAALAKGTSLLSGVEYSEDVLATLDCLCALGAKITRDADRVTVDPASFLQIETAVLPCRESGSTLRFLIPLALASGKKITFLGSERLFARPLDVYDDLCRENGFLFEKGQNSLTVCGKLKAKHYCVRGDISSQFISGLLFALVFLKKDALIEILPPFESRGYVDLTLEALSAFGANVTFEKEYAISVKAAELDGKPLRVEGDYSNAAFLDAFNLTGSSVAVEGLKENSAQGDRVYREYFALLDTSCPTLDVRDCPDLTPVLIALAALKNGATFTGTKRLRAKESDRGAAMQEELEKLGVSLQVSDDSITVPKKTLRYREQPLYSHSDHRIVMALSLILCQTGGVIEGAEAVKKSYPSFFEEIKTLGAKVELICS